MSKIENGYKASLTIDLVVGFDQTSDGCGCVRLTVRASHDPEHEYTIAHFDVTGGDLELDGIRANRVFNNLEDTAAALVNNLRLEDCYDASELKPLEKY